MKDPPEDAMKVAVSVLFDSRLRPLLHPAHRQDGRVERLVGPGTTVKDLVESLRVPHTEVGRLVIGGREVDFSCQVQNHDLVEVASIEPPLDPCRPSLLRPHGLPALKFLVDVNVGRLGRLLRMVGLDCASAGAGTIDADIAARAVREERILLSRDRGLLRHRILSHGHLVRHQDPEQQLAEIIRLYGLEHCLRPFSRCMACNGDLQRVDKEKILHLLEPLTRKYYHEFHRCTRCGRIYWPGSHRQRMERLLATLADPAGG